MRCGQSMLYIASAFHTASAQAIRRACSCAEYQAISLLGNVVLASTVFWDLLSHASIPALCTLIPRTEVAASAALRSWATRARTPEGHTCNQTSLNKLPACDFEHAFGAGVCTARKLNFPQSGRHLCGSSPKRHFKAESPLQSHSLWHHRWSA